MVVPRFVGSRAGKNEPINVHGDGTQSRCFAHVLDIVECLAHTLHTPACFRKVINLGNAQEAQPS